MNDNPDIETWREVPGHPGYEASNLGRLRSSRRREPKVLAVSSVGPCGFRTLGVATPDGLRPVLRVGSLVALAWVGPRPEGAEVRRLDGDTLNDRADNLAYGSRAEVKADHAARAQREDEPGVANLCPEGHRLADSWLGNWGERFCPRCAVLANMAARRLKTSFSLVTACVDCGSDVQQKVGSGRRVQRCVACRARAKSAVLSAAGRKYRAKNPKDPKVRIAHCIDCGVEMTHVGPGPAPLRCATDKAQVLRERARRYNRESRRPGRRPR